MKKKTLRVQLLTLTLIMFSLTVILGTVASIQVFSISKRLNRFMVANYKSIQTLSSMLSDSENQKAAILEYLDGDTTTAVKHFFEADADFQRHYFIEENNITEQGEKELVHQINKNYKEFVEAFIDLQEKDDIDTFTESNQYYKDKIIPLYKALQENIIKDRTINEKAMFASKNSIEADALDSLYLLICITAFFSMLAFIVSLFSSKRISKPIESLTATVKNVRAGNLNQKIDINARNEIGELAMEFNSMIERLKEYDNSTRGQLLKEKTKSMAIIRSISEPLIVLDEQYRIKIVNKSCEETFRISEIDAADKHFLEVIQYGEIFDYISNPDKSEQDCIIRIPKNNDTLYFRVLNTQIDSGGCIVVFQNITQLKELEQLKSDYFSNISHELKTPLTSIIMGSNILLETDVNKIPYKEIVEAINEDASHLNKLVTDILELSRMESGKTLFKYSESSIVEIILLSVKGLQQRALSAGITIDYTFEPDLPPIYVDFDKMTWVFNNLLDNAIKYSSNGGKISVSAAYNNKEFVIKVSDEGIGIPQEYINRVFDKYVRIEDCDIQIRGTGVGLAVVKEIVERHGGTVSCTSNSGKGAEFEILIPAQERGDSI